jgi:regulator of replication initiation timing
VVLPSIRKDGGYILGEENVKTPEDEDALVLRAMEVMNRKIERLRDENTKLTIENDDMREELTIVSIDECRALMHEYWTQRFKNKLAARAGRISKAKGYVITKQERVYVTPGGKVIDSGLNVYHRDVLEEPHKTLSRELEIM